MFEKAKWISKSTRRDDGSRLFRKSITVEKAVKKAVMHTVALGYGEYTVNGRKITDEVLSTPVTKFDSRTLYLTYDVTDFIDKGENVLGVFAGNGWYNDIGKTWHYQAATWRNNIKMIMQLDIDYADGTSQSIISDSSWKVADGPVTYNHVREGETYDARLEIAGWNSKGFDDSLWINASVCGGPGGLIEPVDWVPIKIIRTLEATHIGGGIYDFGENVSGWVRIKTSGKAGTEIQLVYAELLKPDGKDIDNENINSFTYQQFHTDKYILNGKGTEEWEPRFVYHGFRYVKVVGAPEDFEITGCVVHTDLQSIGSFECSDGMLNKIHKATRLATLTNFAGMPTDCPHREQNGWTGDAQLSCQQALHNFEMVKSYKKWLNDFKDAQRPDGSLPGIIPTASWYDWNIGPAWDGAIINIPWQIYQLTGDDSAIKQMWENMKLYLSYLDTLQDDGILYLGLGDWCAPEHTDRCPNDVTSTADYSALALTMGKCAAVMGEDPKPYEEISERIKLAWRKKYLNNTALEAKQTCLACGIYFGMYTNEEAPQKAAQLAKLIEENGWHIDCGILGAKYIFSALSDNGYGDVLYKMVTVPTYPSYAYWINCGMTTLCEDWEMKNSLNHHMYSEVDHWFYRHLAGIKIDENGIVIEPDFISALDWVKATHKNICVEWTRDKLTLTVPCEATVIIKGKAVSVSSGTHSFTLGGNQ